MVWGKFEIVWSTDFEADPFKLLTDTGFQACCGTSDLFEAEWQLGRQPLPTLLEWHRDFEFTGRICSQRPGQRTDEQKATNALVAAWSTPGIASQSSNRWSAHQWLFEPLSVTPSFFPLPMAFSKLKAHLRKAAARTIDDLWRAVGKICDVLSPEECRNYFRQAGYGFE
jgi:hypothetical protein